MQIETLFVIDLGCQMFALKRAKELILPWFCLVFQGLCKFFVLKRLLHPSNVPLFRMRGCGFLDNTGEILELYLLVYVLFDKVMQVL